MLRTYEEKVNTIKNEIKAIANTVIEANKESLSALKNDDISLLKEINISLKKLVAKSNDIDNLIVTTLALYSPEAKDLRQMVAYLKITNELIRAGANTKTFIKTLKKSLNEDLDKSLILEYAIPLQKSSTQALQTAILMIDSDDKNDILDYFNKVTVEESKTDDLYAMIEKNILKLISKNLELSKDYFDVLSSLRRLEKIADRATSIANLLQFAQIGGEL